MDKNEIREARRMYLKSKEGRRNIMNCIFAVIIAVFFLFPIYWLIQMSFKTDIDRKSVV